LDAIGALGAEDEDRTRVRIEPQMLLHERRQAIQALAEIDSLGCDQDADVGRGDDHEWPRKALMTAASDRASTRPRTRTMAPPTTISMVPASVVDAFGRRSGFGGATGAMTAGANIG